MLAVGITKDEKGVKSLELPQPVIKEPNEVLIKILKAGICGTDRNIIQHHLFDPPKGENTMVLGHESFGIVEDVGSDVTDLKKGDYVTATARRGCGECSSCLNNQSDMCFTGRYKERGLHGLHGFFTQYVVEDQDYVVKVPQNLKETGVLAEPMSIVTKGVEHALFIQSRLPWTCDMNDVKKQDFTCRTAVVIGAGPIGFLATCLLKYYGMETYFMERKDESNFRIKQLQSIGAKYIDIRKNNMKDLTKITGNIDIMFEASGASEFALNLIPHIGRNGIYVLTGIPRGEFHATWDMNLMLRHIVRYNQTLLGILNGNRDHFDNSLRDIEQIDNKYNGILTKAITTKYKLEDYEKAIFDKDPNNIKVIFDM
tara:strand:+ start:1933 stop:3042 length:1110 start_codon:yes stop_codon:yes gene_type:complete